MRRSASNCGHLRYCLTINVVVLAVAGLLFGCLSLTIGLARDQDAPNATTNPMVWPLSGTTMPDAAISSPFGPRWQASQARCDYHPGIDIAAPRDTPVHSIASGTVFKVGWLSADSGLAVIVHHASLGFYSAYLHLNSTPVSVGQDVSRGEVIGYVGNTGTTDFYHLHTEIRLAATDYPTSTRNPMGYLPHPDVTTPTIRIVDIQSEPIYSPTVSLVITTARGELDLNQVRVMLHDRGTGAVMDEQYVDFNLRAHTGQDSLDQDGIQLIPSPFDTSSTEYVITATFYSLQGFDSFTLTAQAIDLAGHAGIVAATVADTTPPERITTLTARWRPDGGVDLVWIAPGDSDWVGTANAYDVRFSRVPIYDSNWYSASSLPDPPAPVPGGQVQTMYDSGPFPNPVYFAVRAMDDEGNISPVSSCVKAQWRMYLPVAVRRSLARSQGEVRDLARSWSLSPNQEGLAREAIH